MMTSDIFKKEATILYLLYKGPIYGRKRLQKLLFLAKEKYLSPIPFTFVNYHYGPYSFEIQKVLDVLVMSGLVHERVVRHENKLVYKYELTEKGKIIAKFLQPPNNIKEGIDITIKNYGKKRTDEIVSEAYELIKRRRVRIRDQ